MTKPHSQWAWTKASRQLKAEAQRTDEPCHLCGRPIDYTAPQTSRWSFTADHINALGNGGDLVPEPGGLRPAHRGCNSKRGTGNNDVEPTSRRW